MKSRGVALPSRSWSRPKPGGADLIVMGVSGQGGQGLGSVAEGVVRASVIPVLTVKASEVGS